MKQWHVFILLVALCAERSRAVSCAAGAALLPSYEGGKAVRCAQEAVNLCKAAGKAAAVYDQTAPRTVASEHQLCDAAFTDLITTTFNKVW